MRQKTFIFQKSLVYKLDFIIKVVGYNITSESLASLNKTRNQNETFHDVPYFSITLHNKDRRENIFDIQDHLNKFIDNSDWIEIRYY